MSHPAKILLVDDDIAILKATRLTLESAGYEVSTATTGAEGLRLATAQPPDLALLDRVLPDLDGAEICRHLKTNPITARVFVVLLSGMKMSGDDQADGLQSGADGYIVRPISNRELLARIEAMLRIKQAEARLRQYAERLEQMVDERTRELSAAQEHLVRQTKLATLGQFAGSVGHELRNPLGVLSNVVYLLRTTYPNADEPLGECLSILSTQVHKAEKIVADLLDFARTKMVERENMTVAALVAQVLAEQPPPANIEVSTRIDASLPPAWVDPQQIGQVLTNLVVNAYQAMPGGGGLDISAKMTENNIALAVTDTGDGISPENLNKLFEPLFTTKAEGVGLGLAVSKNLVEANGGRIEVQSQPGQGATFTIILPPDNR